MNNPKIKLTIIGLFFSLNSCGGGGGEGVDSTQPLTFRSGVSYGYYSSYGNQLDETKDHINLIWESQWEGIDRAALRMKQANLPVILDVSAQLLNPTIPRTVSDQAPNNLREFFQFLRGKGVLDKIAAIYPVDEPDLNIVSYAEISKAVSVTRMAMAEFPELANAKVAVIFAGASRLTAIELFDWVGIDDYDLREQVLGQSYTTLRQHMTENQRTMLAPGGAFGQDPMPFVNFANKHSEVIAIIPFIWFDNWGDQQRSGIRSNGMAPQYRQAGLFVLSGKN